MQVQLRRYRDILKISGTVIIAFGVWSLVKTAIWFVLLRDQWVEILANGDLAGLENWQIQLTVGVFLAVFMLLGLCVNIWIGRGAIREAGGQKLRRPYVTVAVLLAILTVIGLIPQSQTTEETDAFRALFVNSTLIDLSMLFALAELIRAARKVRRLTKEIESGAGSTKPGETEA